MGSPIFNARMRSTNWRRKSSKMLSATKKRFAAMHDWPLLIVRALRHVGCMFEQPHVSGHQRWRGKPKDLPEREIPRHDGQDGSEWLVAHVTARGIGLRGLVFQETL